MDEKVGVKITNEEGVAVITFKATSISYAEEIAGVAKEIEEFIEQNRPKRVIFDFVGVKFFSSQVLGLLLNIRDKVQKYDGEVVISAINPQLHKVFKITSLEKVFRFFPDKESAIKGVKTN
jgi:anti-sigma B factor antagonist